MADTAVAVAPATTRSNSLRLAFIALIGLIAGAAAGMNWLVTINNYVPSPTALLLCVGVVGILGAAVLVIIDLASRPLLAAMAPDGPPQGSVLDPLSYLPAALPLLGVFGVFVPIAATLLLLLLARGGAMLAALPKARRGEVFSSMGWLAFLFLISGFAALIYQIVWQRTLFTAFGVNIESITIIVSLFMFGLGIGSFVGGLLSHKFPNSAPLLFFGCEAGIGIFGLVSLPLIGAVSRATLHGSLWQVAGAVFALLCVPTMLMGATLPILVTHLYRHLRSVGKSVGLLYCINTVGSAVACFLTADVLFALLGQQASVLVAAACNMTVGLLVFRFARRIARRNSECGIRNAESKTAPAGSVDSELRIPNSELAAPRSSMAHRWFVLFFSAATGYIS
ncbi:MAG: fused MFS/spermidine synthase, partial [Phycisphaerae bacterium]|nr:fused MFS/spermidine synthase [Phycisphaerae bacterium]